MGERLRDTLVIAEQLDQRLAEMTEEVDRDHAGKEIFLIGVPRGVVTMMTDLSRKTHTSFKVDWVVVSSHGSGTKSPGVTRIFRDLDQNASGRCILIVEDIIDSGLTLSWLRTDLLSCGAASVRTVTILRKSTAVEVEVEVIHAGFEIPNEFVVGYGLNYVKKCRSLLFVGTLAPHICRN